MEQTPHKLAQVEQAKPELAKLEWSWPDLAHLKMVLQKWDCNVEHYNICGIVVYVNLQYECDIIWTFSSSVFLSNIKVNFIILIKQRKKWNWSDENYAGVTKFK